MSEGGSRPLPAGWRLVFHEAVDSTNDTAMALARDGAGEGTVVWARRQSKGRGRQGRTWISASGNLYCSTIVRPSCLPVLAATLGFVAALATAETVASFPVKGDVRIKWPNDVLINGAKVAGILIEADMDASGMVGAMVVGIGINIAHAPPSVETRYPTTCLNQVAIEAFVDPEDVLGRLCAALDEQIALWRRGGFGPIRDRWLARAAGLGEPIFVGVDGDVRRGRFEGLADDGALILRDGSGLTRISAGDVLLPGRG